MSRTLYHEFRDEMATTRYPFVDNATLTPTLSPTDGLVINRGTFLDASLYPIGGVPPLRLSSIVVTPRLVTVSIGDASGASRASAAFNPLRATEMLALTDSYGRPAGVLVADTTRLLDFLSWPPDTYLFTAAATEFVATCVIPLPFSGVRGILDDQGNLLTGDVWLVGDNGVVLRGDGSGGIRVDVVGDPLSLRALCKPLSLFETPNFVRTINGCPPDDHSNFNLTVGDHENSQTILRIFPTDGALAVETVGDPAVGGTA